MQLGSNGPKWQEYAGSARAIVIRRNSPRPSFYQFQSIAPRLRCQIERTPLRREQLDFQRPRQRKQITCQVDRRNVYDDTVGFHVGVPIGHLRIESDGCDSRLRLGQFVHRIAIDRRRGPGLQVNQFRWYARRNCGCCCWTQLGS